MPTRVKLAYKATAYVAKVPSSPSLPADTFPLLNMRITSALLFLTSVLGVVSALPVVSRR
jgi:hypothetical protein